MTTDQERFAKALAIENLHGARPIVCRLDVLIAGGRPAKA